MQRHAAERLKFKLNVATPPQLAPNKAMKDWIKASQAPVVLGNDPEEAVRGADCVVTDTWVSMGDKEGEHRHNVLRPYQVNAHLMSLAKPDALFMSRRSRMRSARWSASCWCPTNRRPVRSA